MQLYFVSTPTSDTRTNLGKGLSGAKQHSVFPREGFLKDNLYGNIKEKSE